MATKKITSDITPPNVKSREITRQKRETVPDAKKISARSPKRKTGTKAVVKAGSSVSKKSGKRALSIPSGDAATWTPEYVAEVGHKMVEYIQKTSDPSVAEFCYLHGVHRQRLYEFQDLDNIRDWLVSKKIAYYERAGMRLTKEDGGRASFIIFALKQCGWKDKHEVQHSGSIQAPTVEITLTGAATVEEVDCKVVEAGQ